MPSTAVIRPLIATALILLIPLIAMQFESGVNWSPFDFLVAGILLFGTGLAYEVVIRKVKSRTYRIGICIAIALAFLAIWAQLAVGIF
jgi:hypothetical protein